MSDRFDGKARDVVDTFADSFEENQYAATLGEARREVAAALRSTAEEAELKALEWAIAIDPFDRVVAMRRRIAELKKGEL